MSQLYQLFCEGLKDRGDVLSSTVIVTSTPLELEESEDQANAGPVWPSAGSSPSKSSQHPDPNAPSGTQSQSGAAEPEKEKLKESPDFSLQGQVGSATESPPVDLPDDDVGGVGSPAAAALSQPQQSPPSAPTQAQQSKKDEIAELTCNVSPDRYLRERNANVSSIDFVDRAIAAKRREDALGIKAKRTINQSESTDESLPHHEEPAIKTKKGNDTSDSSETDFEGASDYYKSHQTQSSATQLDKTETVPKKHSLSTGKSTDESNLHLVMECISSDHTCPSDSVPCETDIPLSPSAARCRLYISAKRKTKTGDSQANPVQRINEGIKSTIDGVIPNEGLTTKPADTNTFKSAAVLKGVIAYVEVRSGHDNRSMGVRTQLRNLGATVLEKLNSQVTHVVFNEGVPSTLRKARQQGCHLVSVLWIDECKKLGRIVPEADHPPLGLHLYEEPHTYRKLRSFQPDFEEGKAEEKQKKKLKRLKARSKKATSSQQPTTQRIIPSQDSSLDEESSDVIEAETEEKETQQKKNIPEGVALKTLRIVLKKIDAIDSTGVSISLSKKNKRRLLPLHHGAASSLSLEDIDLAEKVKPAFPYSQSSSSSQKKKVASRRIVKHQSSSSQSLHRRSSCFIKSTQSLPGSKQKRAKAPMRTMVCTFMHRREIDVVAAVLKQLGGWILEPTVSPRTTHVVCGESKRTINLLRGIARGCWIIRQEWVLRSLEAGYWLDEEPFELTEYPAIQRSRVARETLGASPDIFSSAGDIYVSKDCTPPHAEVADLLQLCGAHLAKSARQAKVIVGPYQKRASHTNVVHVNEQWVLDSIQENLLLPVRNYRL